MISVVVMAVNDTEMQALVFILQLKATGTYCRTVTDLQKDLTCSLDVLEETK